MFLKDKNRWKCQMTQNFAFLTCTIRIFCTDNQRVKTKTKCILFPLSVAAIRTYIAPISCTRCTRIRMLQVYCPSRWRCLTVWGHVAPLGRLQNNQSIRRARTPFALTQFVYFLFFSHFFHLPPVFGRTSCFLKDCHEIVSLSRPRGTITFRSAQRIVTLRRPVFLLFLSRLFM